MRDYEWPEVVPVLSASDICRGKTDGNRGTHCLVGWARSVFPGVGTSFTETNWHHPVIVALRQKCPHGIAEFNDDCRHTKKEIADVWNSVVKKLGYTVPCDRPKADP